MASSSSPRSSPAGTGAARRTSTLKVHIDKKTVLTSQLFFDPGTVGEIYAAAPYSDHAGWESNTQNSNDGIYDPTGLVTTATSATGYLGAINLGVDV